MFWKFPLDKMAVINAKPHMSNTRPAGWIRATRPCHVALAPSFTYGTWRNSIPPSPALTLSSLLSFVNIETFCVYKEQLCSQQLLELTDPYMHSRQDMAGTDLQNLREGSPCKKRQSLLHRKELESSQVGDAWKLFGGNWGCALCISHP